MSETRAVFAAIVCFVDAIVGLVLAVCAIAELVDDQGRSGGLFLLACAACWLNARAIAVAGEL